MTSSMDAKDTGCNVSLHPLLECEDVVRFVDELHNLRVRGMLCGDLVYVSADAAGVET